MTQLVTFGETMIKLAPPGHLRLEQATQVDLTVGGTESNVAVALSRLGKDVTWFSRLPDNPLGDMVVNLLRQYGVNVAHVIRAAGERIGTYYAEFGSEPRPIQVWYDRANSAASKMTPDNLPLDLIAGADWMHLTGITPALSESCRETVAAAIDHAVQNGVRVTFDVNYRALLWSPEAAGTTLTPFCEAANYVFVAGRDAVDLFGASDVAETAAVELQKQWGGTVIVSDGNRGVYGCDGGSVEFVPAYECDVVDRFGAGDAMAAGILCRLIEDATLVDAMRFGAATAALALTIPGDIAIISRQEVEAVIENKGGAVRR